jgi:hypothetical protein
VFNNQGGDYPIPYVLNVGHDFMSKADQVDLVSRIRDTYFYAGIAHSSANKPVMVRVKYTEPKQRSDAVGREKSAEMSRSLLNYVGPTLPGMNVTRPS